MNVSEDSYDLRALVDRLLARAMEDTAFARELAADPATVLNKMGAFSSQTDEAGVRTLMGQRHKDECDRTCLKTCKTTDK